MRLRNANLGMQAHFLKMDLTLASNFLPCSLLPPTGQKPLIFNSLRACATAWDHLFFLPRAEAFLDTTLPALFLTRLAAVRPLVVFSFLPLSTAAFAPRPFAILLTFFTFFIAFIAFEAFMALAFPM